MKRPSVDEDDVGSYLCGSISTHQVERLGDKGVTANGEPDYDDKFMPFYTSGTLCRSCSHQLARQLGFLGPVPVPVTYQRGLSFEVELCMLKFAAVGLLTHVAEYSYGRDYFKPGETRTRPCSTCGAETLISAGGYEDE